MPTVQQENKFFTWMSGNLLTILVIIISTVMGYGRLSTRVDDMSITLQKIVDKVEKIDERQTQNQFFVIQKITEHDGAIRTLTDRVTWLEQQSGRKR